MSRKMTGFVPGGVQKYALPSAISPGDLAVHAVGRLNTMAEVMVQSACLRSLSLASRATGYGRAIFQDVKGDYSGTNSFAAAHRALFALLLDGRNAADLPHVSVRPELRRIVIAPQARTDLVMRPVNYADQLLENAVSGRVFGLFSTTLMRQSMGKPVEKNLMLDTAFRLKSLLVTGFDEAAGTFQKLQRKRGWQEFRGPVPCVNTSGAQLDDKAPKDEMSFYLGGPTHYGDLPELVLGTSQEITERALPDIAKSGEIERVIAAVESRAK